MQIINELASRGLCDPLLPTDSDDYALIDVARKRLDQASETVRRQTDMQGVLVIIDAADNAQLEADYRGETAFPSRLLASLSNEPIDGVKLLLTARPHRMANVVKTSVVNEIELVPFTRAETLEFLVSRRNDFSETEFSTAFARSGGNARVLEYLVESWDANVAGDAVQSEITAEELIAEKCDAIIRDLRVVGWSDDEAAALFAALSLLPPPIPLSELAHALEWSEAQVNSAVSDLAPMLEVVKHGAIIRDEPTETYIRERFGDVTEAQDLIASRLLARQDSSMYAAESLPYFLVITRDSARAQSLADSDIYPAIVKSDYARRRIKLIRLNAAFSLAVKNKDFDRILPLTVKLAEVASANAKGDAFIRSSAALATLLGDPDVSRRLFNDRSGWRGAREARLVIAYCFSQEFDEARIYQRRAIGWINWYLNNAGDFDHHDRPDIKAIDVAAIMFLNVIEGRFEHFDRHIALWHPDFAIELLRELISLCSLHEEVLGGSVFQELQTYAASTQCECVLLKLVLLSEERDIAPKTLAAVSRSASSFADKFKADKDRRPLHGTDHISTIAASAAMCSLIVNSQQASKRILSLCTRHRPSGYDYTDRHDMGRIWLPIEMACAGAWSSGKTLSIHDLIPQDIKINKAVRSIQTISALKAYLNGLTENKPRSRGKKAVKQKKYSTRDCEAIAGGIEAALKLVETFEDTLLSNSDITNETVSEFLDVWASLLRPDIHWNSETGKDALVRRVGLGFALILLQHSSTVDESTAQKVVAILKGNRFRLGDRLRVLSLLAQRSSLSSICGTYANQLRDEISKDDYIEQRGDSYRELANALLPMSMDEARHYYIEGLAQLDQMGGNDHDFIYGILHFATQQSGGFIKPALAHRLMNLCHAIFNVEAGKFGWTLFGRAAAVSLGFSAFYKLLRWHDQDIADYSYGMPQLACFLTRYGHLDGRRAAIILTVCKEHGWHDWRIGEGLQDVLRQANSADRQSVFSVVFDKLERENATGGWEGNWTSLSECIQSFAETKSITQYDQLRTKAALAKARVNHENARRNSWSPSSDKEYLKRQKKEKQDREKLVSKSLKTLDLTSVTSIDAVLKDAHSQEQLAFETEKALLAAMLETCPYDQRIQFLKAICQSNELEFYKTMDILAECKETWSESSASLNSAKKELVETLLAFKGSQLFDVSFSRLSRELYQLSEFCDDAKFVLKLVLEIVVKERIELTGQEWLEISERSAAFAKPETAYQSLEGLLASSTANVGDEIGEGPYRSEFAGQSDEKEVLADIIWHLLGDSDAFIRWNTARSLTGLVGLGLIEDVGCLLERFDLSENPSLVSDEHKFAFMNAQQWLLMGLSRAALHHGKALLPVKAKLLGLAKRTDLHAVNKLHVVRCLRHIEGGKDLSPEVERLWDDVRVPEHGIITRDGYPDHKEAIIDFSFGYEFDKYNFSELGRLFWISDNEARDLTAQEILRLWPDAKRISQLPGTVRYRPDERYETYPEHVQRHARLQAATKLKKIKPVSRSNWDGLNPWIEFLAAEDVSFENGSWLSDHKDEIPPLALKFLLAERKDGQDTLIELEALLRSVGLAEINDHQEILLFGSWKSPDGVSVRISSALVPTLGAIKKCCSLAKAQYHDLWLPMFDSDGSINRHIAPTPFEPLIHDPECYPIGIDEQDEWASRAAIARPRLGLLLNKKLGLKSTNGGKNWQNGDLQTALRTQIWGQWRNYDEPNAGMYNDDGSILYADQSWLNQSLTSFKRSIVFTINVSKYRSRTGYDEDSKGVKAVYVGLYRPGEKIRIWHAKLASRITHW